ncbi:MAG: hypothetical protein RL017_923 [Pseudomonadota bacterium]|jgi:hypothetical protein
MKYNITPLIVCLFISTYCLGQTKVIGECSLQFSITQQKEGLWTALGSKKIFIKGSQCKTIFNSPYLQQTLIFNLQEDSALVLKEIGQSKFLQTIKYPPLKGMDLISMKAIHPDSTIIIKGYLCKELEMQWADGSVYEVIYTTEIIPTVPNYELAFKEVPGLVMAYTVKSPNGVIVKYELNQIDLNPITLSQFEVNKSIYQIIEK